MRRTKTWDESSIEEYKKSLECRLMRKLKTLKIFKDKKNKTQSI